MEILELITSLFELLKTTNGAAFVVIITYVLMAGYIYRLTIALNSLQKTVEIYKEQSDRQLAELLQEFRQMSRIVYKMAGKLEVE